MGIRGNLRTVNRLTPAQISDPVALEVKIADGSTVGYIRKTPDVLTGIFTETARQLYSADNGLGLKHAWLWSKNPSNPGSEIWINASAVWVDKEPDFRPAIYVALGPVSYTSRTGQQRGRISMTLAESEYDYAMMGSGQVEFIHMGRTQGETMALVSNTADLLTAFADPIREDFCFRTLNVTAVNPPKVDQKEPRERFRGGVTVTYSFEDTWTLKLEAPKLKRIVMDIRLNVLNELGLN